jgi:hypothetical protein
VDAESADRGNTVLKEVLDLDTARTSVEVTYSDLPAVVKTDPQN